MVGRSAVRRRGRRSLDAKRRPSGTSNCHHLRTPVGGRERPPPAQRVGSPRRRWHRRRRDRCLRRRDRRRSVRPRRCACRWRRRAIRCGGPSRTRARTPMPARRPRSCPSCESPGDRCWTPCVDTSVLLEWIRPPRRGRGDRSTRSRAAVRNPVAGLRLKNRTIVALPPLCGSGAVLRHGLPALEAVESGSVTSADIAVTKRRPASALAGGLTRASTRSQIWALLTNSYVVRPLAAYGRFAGSSTLNRPPVAAGGPESPHAVVAADYPASRAQRAPPSIGPHTNPRYLHDCSSLTRACRRGG